MVWGFKVTKMDGGMHLSVALTVPDHIANAWNVDSHHTTGVAVVVMVAMIVATIMMITAIPMPMMVVMVMAFIVFVVP